MKKPITGLCSCGNMHDAWDAGERLIEQMREHDCPMWAMAVLTSAREALSDEVYMNGSDGLVDAFELAENEIIWPFVLWKVEQPPLRKRKGKKDGK